MITVSRYTPAFKPQWDAFVREARNSTFLFFRDYMDYHADRFEDCSWIARKGNRTVALLPANITDYAVIHSHQGLTYGGWILPSGHVNGEDVLEIFSSAIDVWQSEGISALDYKTLPYIYHRLPSQEDEYALFRLGARLTECNLSSAIKLNASQWGYNKLRKRALATASRLDFSIREYTDAAPLIELTASCLRERHDTEPVHTVAEMQRLKDTFPDNIRFWILEYDNAPQAAVCIYDTGAVAHAQYIATTPLGRELNLLTPLFDRLITEIYSDRAYFDFGTSNENHGLHLNTGLLRQKSSFGATGVAYNRFSLTL